MKSIRDIYKIGKGPSSSHTMGPEKAAKLFRSEHPEADSFVVTLYGSLSKTGVGHGTDRVLLDTLGENRTKIVFSQESWDGMHPNTMDFIAMKDGEEMDQMRVESVGGGDIRILGRTDVEGEEIYPEHSFAEIHDFCKMISKVPKVISNTHNNIRTNIQLNNHMVLTKQLLSIICCIRIKLTKWKHFK